MSRPEPRSRPPGPRSRPARPGAPPRPSPSPAPVRSPASTVRDREAGQHPTFPLASVGAPAAHKPYCIAVRAGLPGAPRWRPPQRASGGQPPHGNLATVEIVARHASSMVIITTATTDSLRALAHVERSTFLMREISMDSRAILQTPENDAPSSRASPSSHSGMLPTASLPDRKLDSGDGRYYRHTNGEGHHELGQLSEE